MTSSPEPSAALDRAAVPRPTTLYSTVTLPPLPSSRRGSASKTENGRLSADASRPGRRRYARRVKHQHPVSRRSIPMQGYRAFFVSGHHPLQKRNLGMIIPYVRIRGYTITCARPFHRHPDATSALGAASRSHVSSSGSQRPPSSRMARYCTSPSHRSADICSRRGLSAE